MKTESNHVSLKDFTICTSGKLRKLTFVFCKVQMASMKMDGAEAILMFGDFPAE